MYQRLLLSVLFLFLFHILQAQGKTTGSPPHTPMSEIFQGDGDDPIVCYKQKHRNFFFITFGLVIALGLLALNQYKIKRRSANELSLKNKIIEEKNKDIVDSINYALRIQQAILPDEKEMKRLLPESFLFFQPKDIVSGDFYWLGEKNGTTLIAIADCTGHGVPGAFMSMIGNAFLNEIILEKGIISPAQVLDVLREKIITSLKQGGEGGSKDGMDIVLVALNEESGGTRLKFAGANNPLWLIRKGILTEIKGDKQPIGHTEGNPKPFTAHEVVLDKGDEVCLFSDGFADQFGGKDGKKFRYKRMQELLLGLYGKAMGEQQESLRQTMNNWKAELEQVDDILVLGIRV